ncbi:MAG: class II fructose-bisphosphate aldolase [Alphaproteobacteria bacterium]|nr:MAG: class II fructose-bisphosphate aldolase [Alphaproteobacteria bacterium]
MTKLKPGVVTGKEYLALVRHCKKEGYALPAINVTGTNTVNAALEGAAKSKSDIIIQLSNGGAQFFAGKGIKDVNLARVIGAVSAARHVHTVAKAYGICVVLHTDHANKGLIPWVESMVEASEAEYEKTGRPLFSSHMLDLSEEPIEENLAECERILKRLAKIDMSLEIELGVTGGEEDGVGSDLDQVDNNRLYTQPSEVLQAYEKLSPIGHFSVAAAFGNVHGVYKPGNVQLRPEILKQSQKHISEIFDTDGKPLDFVFHGGSGSSPEEIREAVSYGVFKMNVDTDTQFAFSKAVGPYVEAHPKAFKYQIDPEDGTPFKKHYDPRAWLRDCEVSMAERVQQACNELGSSGKSIAAE